jgi:RNA polymerase sigma factor (sigma-70 family)
MEDLDTRLRDLLAEGQSREALALLHQAYAADLWRYLRFLRPTASIEDLCQEVWLAAGRALPRFRFRSMARTWLFGIARRRLSYERRKRRASRFLPLPTSRDGLEQRLTFEVLGLRRPSTPSSGLRRKLRATALEAELTRLNPADRELLELRFVAGLKPSGIVQVLNLGASPNTISQRLVRLTRLLRRRLQSRAGLEPT